MENKESQQRNYRGGGRNQWYLSKYGEPAFLFINSRVQKKQSTSFSAQIFLEG